MSTAEVDDTDTGSANSDDSLDPDPCVYEEFFDCDDGSLDRGDDFYDADDGSTTDTVHGSRASRREAIPERVF